PDNGSLGLFVGDIRTPLKNLDTVLRALVDVPHVHLAVAGGVERSPYPALAFDLGLADRVHFLGFRSDVAELMRAVDMFVFPSRAEACPLVMLEAMASGLPIIIASTVGAKELVEGKCGYVLDDPNNVQALASAIQTLADNRDCRAEMGEAARAVAEQHTWA